jgi:DNA-binding response OmpR family regulator
MQKYCLIVDDEAAVCQMVKKVLTSAGMEAVALTKSSEAPSLLNERKFEMAFLDLHMASPDGIELVRQMRHSRWNRTTPVILISDDERPSAMSVGFEAGASFFLYKPIDRERLLKLIRATQGTMEYGRRWTRRVMLQSKVRLKFGAEVLEGETVDVSLSGILVKADRTLAMGSPVHISLDLSPRLKPVVGAGSVVRVVGGNQMGFKWTASLLQRARNCRSFSCPWFPASSVSTFEQVWAYKEGIMEIIQAFQVAARKCGFVEVEECGDGTVLWFRKATTDAATGTHHRMCIDSLTNSATVYWTNVRGKIDSKTFRSVATLQKWISNIILVEQLNNVASASLSPGGLQSAPVLSIPADVRKCAP